MLHPGLASHPQHELALRQMRGFGGTFSFRVRGGQEAVFRMLERCRVFTLAESLGGVESLIDHPATMTHVSIPPEVRLAMGIGDDLIRLSVGVEDIEDLLAGLVQAIGNMALSVKPGLKVYYTAADDLFIELIQAIEKNTRLDFKNKYRGLDLLMLDDVHYLVGKERLQEAS